MDYFNISSELAKAKEPAFKSGMLKKYAKGGFTGRSEYKRSIENDIRVGMYRNGGPIQGMYPYNPSIIPNSPFLNAVNNSPVLTARPIISNNNNLDIANTAKNYFPENKNFDNQIRFPQTRLVPEITNVPSPVNNLQVPTQMQIKEMAKGGLIKRADGSYSRRGLWDNIRANRGSGKKPTKQMLEQEKKIKAKTKYEKGGKNPIVLANNDYDLTQAPKEGNYLMPDVNRPYYVDAQGNERSEYRMGVNLDGKETLIPTVVNGKQLSPDQAVQRYYQTGLHMGQFNSPEEAEYASQLRTKKYNVLKDAVRSSPELEKFSKGGYRVSRTSERKGKTHKVTGPDGSVKYFGDPSMGERSKSKYGKDAFYKRHAKSLKKNPHFRAYAKATWSDGGLVSESDLFNLSSY